MPDNRNVNYVFSGDSTSAVRSIDKLLKSFDSLKSSDTAASKISNTFKKISDSSRNLANSFKSLHSTSSALTKVFGTLAGIKLGEAFSEGAKEAINYVENLNLFKVAMHDSIQEGQEFIALMSEMYGLDPSYLSKTTGLFYEMAYAVDVPADAAKTLSLNLTALSSDLASLFNVDFEQSSDNLTSGIRGMSRAVVKYGLDLRASTVEAYANAHGITAQFETMNEASREILRYLVAIEQASDAQGDFARTIESPANQLRIFKEQITQFGRAVGNFIVAPLASALPYITGFVMAIRNILEGLAELLGFMKWTSASTGDFTDSTESASSGISSIGTSADKATKKLKNMLSPFDELNILSQDAADSSSGVAVGGGMGNVVDPKILELLDSTDYKLQEVKLKANEVRDEILDFMGIRVWKEFDEDTGRMITRLEYLPEVFEKNLINKFPNWEKSIQALFDVDWSYAITQLKEIASIIGKIAKMTVSNIVTDILNLFNINDETLSESIGNINTKLAEFKQFLIDNEVPISNFLTRLGEIVIAYAAIKSVLGFVAPLFAAIASGVSTITGLFAGMSPVISVVSGAVSTLVEFLTLNLTGYGLAAVALFVLGFIDGFKQIWTNSEQFRENVATLISNIGNLISSIVSLVAKVISAIIAYVSPIVETIGNILQPIYPLIVNIINAVVGVIQGFVDILDGVLSGDMNTVIKGFFKVLLGLAEAVMNIAAGVINAVLSVIFGAINGVGNQIYSFVKGIVGAINLVGSLIDKKIEVPSKSWFVVDKIPQIVVPSIDYSFAKGGVVTGPTTALIGEAGYSEAVIPLDNSPQMQQLVDTIANAVRDKGNNDSNTPIEVHVYLDSKEITSAQNRTNRKYGRTQQRI